MPVVEDSDQVLPLFKVGDNVITPKGPGVLVDVQFNTAQYNGDWELEPPSLVVELESGETIHTCLCRIELPKTTKGTRLIHREFNRLWPPKTEAVPEDADMLIPEGDEDPVEPTKRTAEMKDWFSELDKATDEKEVDRIVEDIKKQFPDIPEQAVRAKDISMWAQRVGDKDLVDLMEYALDIYYNMLMRRSSTSNRRQADALSIVDNEFLRRSLLQLLQNEDLDSEDFDVEESPSVLEIKPLTGYEPEYTLVDSYETAYQMAVDRVSDDLMHEPELFNRDWLQRYIREDKLRDVLYDDTFNSVYDDLMYTIDTNIEDAAEEMDVDPDDFLDRDGYVDEIALRVHLEDKLDDFADRDARATLHDPVEYLFEIFGQEDGIKKALEWGGIDYAKAADDAVDIDGPGHFLSGYDGVLEELPDGAVYWRTN